MYKYQLFIIYDVFCNFPMAGDNVPHMWYNMSNNENSIYYCLYAAYQMSKLIFLANAYPIVT